MSPLSEEKQIARRLKSEIKQEIFSLESLTEELPFLFSQLKEEVAKFQDFLEQMAH